MTAPVSSLARQSAKKNALPSNKAFADWTFEETQGVLRSCIIDGPTEKGFDANLLYVLDRDHWQKGNPWVGPRGTPETEQVVLDGVEPQFTPVDEINPCLDRFADALLERRSLVSFVLQQPAKAGSDEEKSAKARAEKVVDSLMRWAQKRKLWQQARSAVKRSRWSTWGTLREYVPESRLTKLVQPQDDLEAEPVITRAFPSVATLDEALDAIFVTAPMPDQCVVYEDPETRERAAILSYTFEDDEFVELWWVDRDSGQTIVRTLTSAREPTDVPLDLGGRLPIVQVDGDLLITDSVRRQQARLNFFESLMVRVGETAGFPERYTTNAQPTGIWLTIPPSDGPALAKVEEGSTTWYLHPTPRALGASITTDLIGIKTTKDLTTGEEIIATPSVIFREPTDPEYAIKACAHAKQSIREECHQGHIGMDGEATTTGWSRVQARASFVTDVNNSRGPLELMLQDFFEVVLAQAALMTNELSDFLDRYRCVVQVQVSPGPIAPEDRTAIMAQVEKGLLSIETALSLLGVEDIAAELTRIRTTPESRLAFLGKQFDLVKTISMGAGIPVTAACEIAGIAPEHLAIIQREVTKAQQDDQTTDDQQPATSPPGPRRAAA